MNIHNDIEKMFIKTSNFRKFSDYITDSVRPVQQSSRHLVGIIDKIFSKISFLYTMPYPILSTFYYLSFPKFLSIYFYSKFYIKKKIQFYTETRIQDFRKKSVIFNELIFSV